MLLLYAMRASTSLSLYKHTYIHIYIHTHTYIHAYMHTCIHTAVQFMSRSWAWGSAVAQLHSGQWSLCHYVIMSLCHYGISFTGGWGDLSASWRSLCADIEAAEQPPSNACRTHVHPHPPTHTHAHTHTHTHTHTRVCVCTCTVMPMRMRYNAVYVAEQAQHIPDTYTYTCA